MLSPAKGELSTRSDNTTIPIPLSMLRQVLQNHCSDRGIDAASPIKGKVAARLTTALQHDRAL